MCGCGSVDCEIVCVAVGVWIVRLCAWLWKCVLCDCVRGCGSVECAIVRTAVEVWIARVCAWLLSAKCAYAYTDDGVLFHADA